MSLVGAPEARCTYNSRPDGVADAFQVILNKIEPRERLVRLLTKEDVRPALAAEAKPCRPKVARVFEACLEAGDAEGPTGAGAGPNRSIICPAREAEAQAPEPDASEEMALGESSKVVGLDFLDAAVVDDPMGYDPLFDQVAQPRGLLAVVLVVVGGHLLPSPEQRPDLDLLDAEGGGHAAPARDRSEGVELSRSASIRFFTAWR